MRRVVPASIFLFKEGVSLVQLHSTVLRNMIQRVLIHYVEHISWKVRTDLPLFSINTLCTYLSSAAKHNHVSLAIRNGRTHRATTHNTINTWHAEWCVCSLVFGSWDVGCDWIGHTPARALSYSFASSSNWAKAMNSFSSLPEKHKSVWTQHIVWNKWYFVVLLCQWQTHTCADTCMYV